MQPPERIAIRGADAHAKDTFPAAAFFVLWENNNHETVCQIALLI